MTTSMVRPFLFAWHFLTAIPLSRRHHKPTASELARSMRWYPLVGFIIGALLVAADQLLALAFAQPVRDVLLILLVILVTRGLHQDGLADTLDGMAGGHSPEERLAIMRDPRIGVFGALGLLVSLGLRYAGLMALPQGTRIPVLLCMPALGRWSMVIAAHTAPYARKEGGLGEPFLAQLSPRDVVWAGVVFVFALPFLWGPSAGALAILSVALIAVGFASLSTKLCGGVTGDTLGATNELAELALLLMAPALLSLR